MRACRLSCVLSRPQLGTHKRAMAKRDDIKDLYAKQRAHAAKA
jgi:hypothetical protein